MSDLHLEFGKDFTFTPIDRQTVLVLAGDIELWAHEQDYCDWLQTFAHKFKAVIIIAGNHEFYHGGDVVTDPIEMQERFSTEFYNVFFLEKETVIVDDVAFIGTTLWTDLKQQDPSVVWSAIANMSDFETIKYNGEPFQADTWYLENQLATKFLEKALAETKDMKQVVVTHHLPSYMGIHPRFQGSDLLNYAYANSRLDNFIFESAPELWIHGHSHESMDWVLGDVTRIVANPRGYEGHELNENFDPQFYIEL